jgi:hypothetical protein
MLKFLIAKFDAGARDAEKSDDFAAHMDGLRENLNVAKSLLDGTDTRAYSKLMNLLEPFSREKITLARMSRNYNITNAWIKAYELIYDLDAAEYFNGPLVHFDNAAFPGSFILAIHHYFNTIGECSYQWFASSLAVDTDEVSGHLDDSYDLHAMYSDQWLMSEKNNGDLTNPANLLDFKARLPPVDLYTGDLGFDVSDDYNAQERLHGPAHFGQMLSGLLVMKPGGIMILKQFTFFEDATISNLAVMTRYFESVHIYKPASSKMDNSEIYVVGKNFRDFDGGKLINLMVEKLAANTTHAPIYSREDMGSDFLNSVYAAAYKLTRNQITKIEANMKIFNEIVELDLEPNEAYAMARDKSRGLRNAVLKKWYGRHQIRRIARQDRLIMKDAFRQKRHMS